MVRVPGYGRVPGFCLTKIGEVLDFCQLQEQRGMGITYVNRGEGGFDAGNATPSMMAGALYHSVA